MSIARVVNHPAMAVDHQRRRRDALVLIIPQQPANMRTRYVCIAYSASLLVTSRGSLLGVNRLSPHVRSLTLEKADFVAPFPYWSYCMARFRRSRGGWRKSRNH